MADKVLIIDADLAFGERLQQALVSLGLKAETTVNDEEGLRLAQADDIAAVLVGLMDDKGSGYGLVTRLRRKYSNLPIAMVLDGDELGADRLKRHKGLQKRADQYLMRPIPFTDFAEAIGQLVDRPLTVPEGQEDEILGAETSEEGFDGMRLFDDSELEELGAGLKLDPFNGEAEIELDEEDVELEAMIEDEAPEAIETSGPEDGTAMLPALAPADVADPEDALTPIPVDFDDEDEEDGASVMPAVGQDATVMQPLSDAQLAALDALGQDPTGAGIPTDQTAPGRQVGAEPEESAAPGPLPKQPKLPVVSEAVVSEATASEPEPPPARKIPLASDTSGIPLASSAGGIPLASASTASAPPEDLDEVQDFMDDLNDLLDEPDGDPGPEGVDAVAVRSAERLGSAEHTAAENLARSNAQLSGENRRLKTRVAGLEQQLETLREELSQKSSERSSARKGDASARRELLEVRDSLNRKEREILELRDQLTQKERTNFDLAEELDTLKEEHAAVQRKLKTVQVRASAGQGALDEADKELERFRVELADVKLSFEESEEAHRETEARLRNDIERMDQEHAMALASVEARAAKATHSLEQEQRSARNTQARLERQLTETEKARDELKSKLDSATADHEEALEAQRLELTTRIDTLTVARDGQKKRADEAEAEVERLNSELQASQELLEEVESSLAEERKGRADDIAERDARVADLAHQHEEARKHAATQERSIEGLNDEIRTRDKRIRDRGETIRALQERIASLEGHIEALGDLRSRALEALTKVKETWAATQAILDDPPTSPSLAEIPMHDGPLTPVPTGEEALLEAVDVEISLEAPEEGDDDDLFEALDEASPLNRES